jgi:Na+-translocating ferredoxin:NAD+ oxidoreductase subunit E
MKDIHVMFQTYFKQLKTSFDTFIHKDKDQVRLMLASLSVISFIGVTNSFEASLGMGIFILIMLLTTALLFKGLQRFLSHTFEFPLFIVLLLTISAVLTLLFNTFVYDLKAHIGIFMSLSVFNIVLFLHVFYKIKDITLKESLFSTLKTSRDIIGLLIIIGFLRELLATGTVHIGTLLPLTFHMYLFSGMSLQTYALPVFNQVPGAFIISSIVISMYQAYQSRKGLKHE